MAMIWGSRPPMTSMSSSSLPLLKPVTLLDG
jgi:hypothetical protein